MPVLLVPLALIGAALASIILLYMYERTFGSPLEGLANSVPVIGGWLKSGVASAVDFGKSKMYGWASTAFHTVTSWLDALTDRLAEFVAATDAAIHAIVDGLDHLTHVTVHEIVKAFVNPVRDLAQHAQADAATALHRIDALGRELVDDVRGIEGDIAKAKHDVLDVIRNVDLPNLGRSLDQEIHAGIDEVTHDLDGLHDWAAGWIDQLNQELGSSIVPELLATSAGLALLSELVRTIARESGLENEGCRRKIKNVCGTDPRGWDDLLAAVTPLFALPALGVLVGVAGTLIETTQPLLAKVHA